MSHVVVVGASLAGLRAAETLRAEGFDGELTIIGSERHLPYDRPPLSKDFLLGKVEANQLGLCDDAMLDALGARWLLGRSATALTAGAVHLDSGEATEPADGVVLTTGARARHLMSDGLDGVHTLRTLDDAVALRADLATASRIVIIGAGFIGTEVASTAVSLVSTSPYLKRSRSRSETSSVPSAAPCSAAPSPNTASTYAWALVSPRFWEETGFPGSR